MSRKPLAILVADPDPITSETITEMLKVHGHAVTAVTEVTTGGEVIKLVLYDVLIVPVDQHPSLLDLSFARLVKHIQPDITIIGISGDVNEPTAISSATIDTFLRKPFTIAQLGEAVRQVANDRTTA